MINRKRFLAVSALWALCVATAFGQAPSTNSPATKDPEALRDVVILLIRHAEKPETGIELTPAGVARANAYTNYFKHFMLDGKPLRLEHIFAATDSNNSHRPRLTAEPLSQSLGLPLDSRFTDKRPEALVDELQSRPHGKQILVCWRHGGVPALMSALGADPSKLLPGGRWPDDVYNWVIQFRFDQNGHLIPGETKCLNEDLMPGDADHKPVAS